MSDPGDDEFDPRMDAVGRFLEELPAAADPQAVVRRYAAEYPQWADSFVGQAVVDRLLDVARADADPPDLSGLTDFRIVRGIAAGGMGVVYEAEQVSLGRRVALKVRYGRPSPEREAGFEREQRVLARLHQSHIVPIYQSGRCGDWQFFAMAFIEGATLLRVLRAAEALATAGRPVPPLPGLVAEAAARDNRADDVGRLADYADDLTSHSLPFAVAPAATATPPGRSFRLPASHFRGMAALLADAADAVAHAHAHGVVHRDLKPSNLMVDAAGQGWLIDFGLAEAVGAATGSAGTPGYIAPERLRPDAAPADAAADVWSLGVTLREAVTLRRPTATGGGATNVPTDLAAVCAKATDPDPDRRYPSARELADDLRRWLADRPTLARPVPAWRAAALWARRNRGWAAAIGGASIALAALAVALVANAGARADRAERDEKVADARANAEAEKAALSEREVRLQEAERLRLGEADNGWSGRAWELLRGAATVRADARVRDLVPAALTGWDAEPVNRFDYGAGAVTFGPDGHSLLVGGFVELNKGTPLAPGTWDAANGRLTRSARAGDGPVAHAADGTPYQLAAEEKTLALRDVATDRAAWSVPLPADKRVRDTLTLALSADARWVAASFDGEPGRTRVWRVPSTEPCLDVPFAAGAVAFSATGGPGRLMAAADAAKRRIIVYSLTTGQAVAELPTGAVPITGLAFGRNPKRCDDPLCRVLLAAGDAGGAVAVWDVRAKAPVAHLRGSMHEILALTFAPDGTLLATGGRQEVRVWEMPAGRPLLRLRPEGGVDYVSGIAFNPAGDRLAVASRGVYSPPSVVVWGLANGRGVARLGGLTGQVEQVSFSADGSAVAALSHTSEVGVWDAATGRLRFLLDVPPGPFPDNAALTFAPDGRTLAYSVGALDRGTAVLLDAATGEELRRWTLPAGLQNRVGFDGPHLWHFQSELVGREALPTSDWPPEQYPRIGRVRDLFAADPSAAVVEVRDFPRHVFAAVLTPDGRRLLVDGTDGRERWVKGYETATGRVTVAHRFRGDGKASDLRIDAGGTQATLNEDRPGSMTRFPLPDGPPVEVPGHPVHAATAGYSLRRGATPDGGVLYRDDRPGPLAEIAAGVRVNAAAFDPAGRRLGWGGKDGAVVIDLETLRGRLNALGVGW